VQFLNAQGRERCVQYRRSPRGCPT
jgi:hypothetical protein